MKCLLNLPFLDKPQNFKPTLINQVIEYEYFWEKSYIFDMFHDHCLLSLRYYKFELYKGFQIF